MNTQKNLLFAVFIALLSAQSSIAAGITLTDIPSGATLGSAGSTVGYGYTITNSTSMFYQATSLNTSLFVFGTPTSIFDFPEVLPNSSVTLLYSQTANASCVVPVCGLLAVILGGAPGSVDSGVFTLSGEFFNDFNETIDAGAAPDVTATYNVGVAPSPTGIPEPSSLGLSVIVWLAIATFTRKRLSASPTVIRPLREPVQLH